ncbi:MAG: DUF4396 domain-containing protein [Terriglobales bacterium]
MRPIIPPTLHWAASLSLALAALCGLWIAGDEARRPQKMWIMNLVWPLTALFGSGLWLAAYYRWGRAASRERAGVARRPLPFAVMVFKGASHCGAGCALGDLIAEWVALAAPAVAVWFGWRSLFMEKMFAVWVLDFVLAFLFGVAFQYFTIAPMRGLSPGAGLRAAAKADIASIAAWQVGMYGVMAIIQFGWFRPAFGALAPVASPEFWFAMQLAMLAGFLTSYPVNWILIRSGLKERM